MKGESFWLKRSIIAVVFQKLLFQIAGHLVYFIPHCFQQLKLS